MRVAIVTESFLPTLNGVTNSVRKVLEHLRRRGHEAIVICPKAGAPSEYAGFAVHEVATVNLREFPVGLPSIQVDQLLRDFDPDIVHAASPFMLGWNALATARRRGIPTVAIFQTDVAGYTERNRLGAIRDVTWLLLRSIHSQADLTLAPSTSSIRDLERNRFERVRPWGRGVDLEAFHPNHRRTDAAAELRASFAGPDDVVVGYVGRLAPEKQVERLAALRGIRNVHLAIVGEGPSETSVRGALDGMPVTYLGRRMGRDLSLAYASFDLFVHTGTEETFGQTLQEAHAAGLPVVAPLAGGPIDLVTHGDDGYLFDPAAERGDDAMRAYVERLVADPGLRARMGEAGRRRVLGRSWEGICDDLLAYYDEAIAAKTAATAGFISL
ncbi:glycosyltransferase family 4 protein [Gulosibacter faecalis]|uniref:D-inositol 3-phosphate glycosyltransferase n=1 Tax=Gulosibacter faecalis TaxID=272240 RepID=A0ABW5UZT6_9MICO|nr:glycosyltransferase family 1 protein [Gulosibacter faecalis]